MIVRLLEVARLELDDAISHYNSQAPALGDAFLLEVVAVAHLHRRPDYWRDRLGK